MLRINLLPSSVAQRRITKRLTAIFSLLFLVCLLAPLAYNLAFQKPNQAKIEQEATDAETEKGKHDKLVQDAAAQRSQIAPIKAKVDYVKQVYDNNAKWVRLYDTMARYTNSDILYSDAAVSGQALSIKAYAPSIAAVGRYLQTMYQEPDFTSVSVDRLPGYPDALVNKYYLGGKLVGIGTPPGGGQDNAAGGFGGGAGSGFGGGGGSYAGGQGGGPKAGRGPVASAASGGGATAGGGSSFGGAGGYSGAPGSGFGGGAGSGFGNSSGDPNEAGTVVTGLDEVINPLASPEQRARLFRQAIKRATGKWNGRDGVRREPKGFEITVTATLKNPPVAPVVPGSEAAGAGASPFGAPGGAGNYGGGPPAGG